MGSEMCIRDRHDPVVAPSGVVSGDSDKQYTVAEFRNMLDCMNQTGSVAPDQASGDASVHAVSSQGNQAGGGGSGGLSRSQRRKRNRNKNKGNNGNPQNQNPSGGQAQSQNNANAIGQSNFTSTGSLDDQAQQLAKLIAQQLGVPYPRNAQASSGGQGYQAPKGTSGQGKKPNQSNRSKNIDWSKQKCHACGKMGHWQRTCRKSKQLLCYNCSEGQDSEGSDASDTHYPCLEQGNE